MIKSMDMESLNGQIIKNMKVNGSMESSMEKVN